MSRVLSYTTHAKYWGSSPVMHDALVVLKFAPSAGDSVALEINLGNRQETWHVGRQAFGRSLDRDIQTPTWAFARLVFGGKDWISLNRLGMGDERLILRRDSVAIFIARTQLMSALDADIRERREGFPRVNGGTRRV